MTARPMFGSLTNRMMERAAQPKPKIGMGATLTSYTDRHAATVVRVTPATVTVQEDVATRIDANGMSEAQSYAYERNPNGRTVTFRRNKHGEWINRNSGHGLILGQRSAYHDFSF